MENANTTGEEGGAEPRTLTLRHGNAAVYYLPANRDGTQCAVSSQVQTDREFVHSMHELVDTMTAGG